MEDAVRDVHGRLHQLASENMVTITLPMPSLGSFVVLLFDVQPTFTHTVYSICVLCLTVFSQMSTAVFRRHSLSYFSVAEREALSSIGRAD